MKYQTLSKESVEKKIKACAKQDHFQQVAYSVHGNCLTQVCFGCYIIRTSYQGEKNHD